MNREFSRVGVVVSGAIESLQTQSRPGHGPHRAAALMQTAGRGISLRQAVRQEQFVRPGRVCRPEFVEVFRPQPTVTRTAFMRWIDE
eukprot:SAG25_NODE_9695_length_361_cov_1.492366_1_plen_86_part_01